jgi:hypothetical protein
MGKGLHTSNWLDHDWLFLEFASFFEMGVRCHVEIEPFATAFLSGGTCGATASRTRDAAEWSTISNAGVGELDCRQAYIYGHTLWPTFTFGGVSNAGQPAGRLQAL